MKKETAKIIFEGGKNAELLSAIADIMDKDIIIHRIGQNSAADVVKCGASRFILSPRISENEDQNAGNWSLSYSIADDGRVAWVWLGHKIAGPCYQCGTDGKWRNCYSHGNFGKNFSSGGNWSGAGNCGPENGYDTISDCINGRGAEIKKGLAENAIFVKYAVTAATKPELL